MRCLLTHETHRVTGAAAIDDLRNLGTIVTAFNTFTTIGIGTGRMLALLSGMHVIPGASSAIPLLTHSCGMIAPIAAGYWLYNTHPEVKTVLCDKIVDYKLDSIISIC